jgi:hypothetical protein
MLRGLPLPPRGSVQSCLLEELIHRERLRKWHYHMSDILALAAQISGNKHTLDKLIDQTSTLYKMEIHAVGAYDSDIEHKTSTEEVKKSDKDLLKILDGLPDV